MNSRPIGSTGGKGGGAEDYILIRDEKPSATAGGTFTSGAWRTRDLNTEVNDDGGHASLSSNQITLEAGTYRVRAHAPAYQVNSHQCKLYNITDAADIITGSSEFAFTSTNVQNRSFLEGRFEIAAPKVLEVQHQGTVTGGANSFGVGSNFGAVNVFAVIEFWKEA